jgi:hypothetical protein
MRNWIGVALLAIAVWLVYAGLAQRSRVLAARRQAAARGEPDADGALHPSLAMLGDIVPPLMIALLVFAGLKATFAYLVMDGGRYLSLLDLGGFLLVLAAYGTWLILKTRYREVGRRPAPVAHRPEAAGAPSRDPGGPRAHVVGSDHPAGAAPGPGRGVGAGGLAAGLAAPGQEAGREREAERRAG